MVVMVHLYSRSSYSSLLTTAMRIACGLLNNSPVRNPTAVDAMP